MPRSGPRSGRTAPVVLGVTGHRDIGPASARKLAALLRAECASLRKAHPRRAFVVLSPLAEGADRLVARVAMQELGASLVVPLPLPLDDRDGYQKDFPKTRRAFQRLLALARQVVPAPLPLRGEMWRRHGVARDRQYAWVGAYVAERADVLFALWDGKASRGTGGTAQVVSWYLAGKVPKAYATLGKGGRPPRGGRLLVHINTRTHCARHASVD